MSERVISREVNDPRVGNITITSVSVSPDMKNARIYFVPFAASKNPLEQVQEGLTRAGGFLRGEVGAGAWACATCRDCSSCSMSPSTAPRGSPSSSRRPTADA